jgi:hypothetical protein
MDLREQISNLAARVSALEDQESIRNALASYGPAVDRGDSVSAAALWAPEGTYDVGGLGVSAGRMDIEALFEADIHQTLIAKGAAHILSPVHIAIHGDVATAPGYSCVFTHGDEGFHAKRVSANLWSLSREGPGWLVVE